jgi:hypothetical protein
MRSIATLRSITAFLLLLVAARPALAADQKAIVEKIKGHNQAAISAYGASDFEEMKTKLLEALALGNENGLAKSKIVAQTYVLLGVLQVDGFKDSEAGVKFFAKALDISPAVQVPNGMSTKAVKAAFKKAEDEDAPAGEPELVETGKAQKPKREKEEPAAREAPAEKKSSGMTAAEKKWAEAEERKQADAERKQAEAERKERDKLMEDLAAAKVGESTAAAEKEKLARDKQERERALADTKGRVQQLEKDKADRDKWLADTKAKLALLEKDKPERDKQLADAKGRIQQLEKDKADRDKWLAATKDSEKKEREGKEKLEKGLQEIAEREKERRAKENEEKQEREKLEAGPDLPGHISEPITCTLPDEVQAGADLFVHCVPQPGVGAKVIALYYRPSGAVVYNAVTMERSRKGWYVALIPGSKISGKLLQYYVEARDGREKLAASNGKANSPNIATVKLGGARRPGKSR